MERSTVETLKRVADIQKRIADSVAHPNSSIQDTWARRIEWRAVTKVLAVEQQKK